MSFTERYDLQVPLGRSPGGIVWQASRKDDDRTVAVAIADGQGLMDESLFERVRERFKHDLTALQKAKQGHLPKVLEIGEDDAANPYAAMELVEGDSLGMLLDHDLPLEDLGKIFDGVLRALEAAHRVRVFHGDIEPGNVLVGEDGTGTLVGFGLNRALAGAEGWNDDDDEHLERSVMHRAPELEAGEAPTDPRADLYGIGVMLHLALTGEPPEEGRSVAVVGPELGASLVKLVDRATDPSPQARYASAWAMRTALNGAVRMAAKGEKPPSGKKTMAGGLKAPKVPTVPKVPSPARVSSPPPAPKASTPPPAPKASKPPPAPKAAAKVSRPKTKPFPIRPDDEPGEARKGSVPPPTPKTTAKKKERPKTESFEVRKDSVPPPAPKQTAKKERPKTEPFEIPSDADLSGNEPVSASETGAGALSSIPPPVIGVGVDARDSTAPRENTEAISLADVDVVSDGPASSESIPPPVPGGDDDDIELPVGASASFFRSPVGLAAVAVIALGLGWAFGRMTAPEPTVDLSEVAAAPTEEAAEPEPPEPPAPEPEVAEPEVAEPTEPEPPAPEPLRLGELPEGVEALVGGAPYDVDAPPALTPGGEPVPLVVQRGEQRVRLSLARDDEGALDLTVLELTEPEPEPVAVASPMTTTSPMTRRARRRSTRRTTMRSGGSLMRPGIAYDPGF